MRVFGAEIVHKTVLHRQKAIFLDAVFLRLRHVYERAGAQVSPQKSLELCWLSRLCIWHVHTGIIYTPCFSHRLDRHISNQTTSWADLESGWCREKSMSIKKWGVGGAVQCGRTCEHSTQTSSTSLGAVSWSSIYPIVWTGTGEFQETCGSIVELLHPTASVAARMCEHIVSNKSVHANTYMLRPRVHFHAQRT